MPRLSQRKKKLKKAKGVIAAAGKIDTAPYDPHPTLFFILHEKRMALFALWRVNGILVIARPNLFYLSFQP